jgi:hypothetical protein
LRLVDRIVADMRSGDSYGLVLVLLLATLFVGIAAPVETWAQVVRDAIFATTVVVVYWTATSWRAFLVPRVLIPAGGLALVVLAALENPRGGAASAVLFALLAGGGTFIIARDLFHRRRVDVQTVLGALSLYVLLAFVFAALFTLVARLASAPFFTRGDDGSEADHLYFSVVTLTTTGYGDLAAAGGVGRALAALEIVIGNLYVVTVVAVLVTAVFRRQGGGERPPSG